MTPHTERAPARKALRLQRNATYVLALIVGCTALYGIVTEWNRLACVIALIIVTAAAALVWTLDRKKQGDPA
jgi:Flp pilus assembly protein TadB